ncbi:cell filamentation protein Fic [Candidatus Peregrinibacteria bacterium CG08_land_8_20_14_0_20_41_10]|nr:MAG: cell filamentation protein Fic [Candidatus Peregrinibacteria bacterium CG08_land_8_20_14_0_20_41_10]
MTPQPTILLNKRQEQILKLVDGGKNTISSLLREIEIIFGPVAKVTLNRDLQKLIQMDFLEKVGKGRSTFYQPSPRFNLLKPINPDQYFAREADQRTTHTRFNFEIFPLLHDVFNSTEQRFLQELNQEYRKNLSNLPAGLLKQELERLTVELSWKSAQIEGNTYSLLETETLLREKKEATGHQKAEATMLLNHKEALDYILAQAKTFQTLSVRKLEEIHLLLTKGLQIKNGLRQNLVGITGTRYKPLDNQFQIRETLEKTCQLVNTEQDPFNKTLGAMILIAYIQPFEDGNKRTSRMIGNAILIAHHCCPLSYRSVNETEYKKAVILFYEQNNLTYFKQLFLEQFEFAVKNYFQLKYPSS